LIRGAFARDLQVNLIKLRLLQNNS
jgi:hypothetical protein